jgi:undecaprenyl pyrophosphate phosphatase UppP
MKKIRISLAIILILYSIPAFLSGLDIHKGTETDLSSEWIIVCIFFALSILLFISNLLELLKRDKPEYGKENTL